MKKKHLAHLHDFMKKFEKRLRDNKGKKSADGNAYFPYPIAIVLYNGKKPWRNLPRMADLIERVPGVAGELLQFPLFLVDLAALKPEQIVGSPVLRAFLTTLRSVPLGTMEKELDRVVDMMQEAKHDSRTLAWMQTLLIYIGERCQFPAFPDIFTRKNPMSLMDLLRDIRPYVRPYRILVILAIILTFLGSLTAQVNAWVLRYTVDSINHLVENHAGISQGEGILVYITAILIGKEVINVLIKFGQNFYGEKLRIYISRDLAQTVIQRILTYRLAFFTSGGNAPGLLQTRMDRGIEAITRLVQNFFIEILPLFANSVVALIVMFNANFYVGLVGLLTLPVYYWVARSQALKLSGSRRRVRALRENKSNGTLSILESIPVIKSFLREDIEEKKQLRLQMDLTSTQLAIRRVSFIYDGFKGFMEQIGVAAIIILTTYFVLKGSMTIGAIMFNIMI